MPKWNAGPLGFFEMPERCHICHHLVVIGGPNLHRFFDQDAELVFHCPNPDCGRTFVGVYKVSGPNNVGLIRLFPDKPSQQELPEILSEISPKFTSIYKEAWEAKQAGLNQICGPGFRKAFEFLIKDYAKRKTQDNPDKEKQIEGAFAGKVVKDFIGDARIKAVAKRALWLGNDETHYLRDWEQHDINDLITLIRLTIHWIEIEQLSQDYAAEMPDDR